jgi:hypothetical protein
LPIGLLAAAVAGITSVSATGVVTLYPATVSVSVDLSPALPVTNLSASLTPVGNGQSSSKSVSVQGAGPYTIDVTVDGGNPADPADAGFSYRPTLNASFQQVAGASSSLQISKYIAVLVNNTPDAPSVTVPAAFNYPVVRRVNGTVTVVGGTVSSYYLYSSASNSAANESYSGNTSASGGSQATVTRWVPMVPSSSVSVYAVAYVVDGNGVTLYRSLASQTVSLASGDADVSWTIDLTNTGARGTLVGDVSLTPPGSTAGPSSVYVSYYGASTSTSGISGSLSVPSSQPSYSVNLNPGNYYVYLSYSSGNPSRSWNSPGSLVAIASSQETREDFTYDLGLGRVALEVKGFYDISKINYAYSYLTSNSIGSSNHSQWPVSSFEHLVPVGDWRSYLTYLRTYDQSNPALPNDNTIYRYHYNDSDLPTVNVTAAATANLGTESVTLVKSNVYFDVLEPEGAPQKNITYPQIYAYKTEYNPDSSLRRQSAVYSYGSSTPKSLSGLTMVAEPGVYTLDARATVDGTNTQFRGTTITFGEPQPTPSGAGVETVLTPTTNTSLQVSLDFDYVNSGGVSTVVETPLGPAPPEGFQVACGTSGACDPIYYDISSTSQWTGETKVCIRRQFPGVSARAGALFQLLHYNELLQTWEELLPPNGEPTAFNCNNNPAHCGCADAASCGITPTQNVFLVCGMTSSFSPFAIFQRNLKFTNKVGGVEYTGPSGPPALQEWEVPADGVYRITATGAQGGSATSSPAHKGGCGAEASGEFQLYAGDIIEILVGQKGTSTVHAGGGGGGTFVRHWASPLVVAGGGGGVRSGALVDGRSGDLTCHGNAGSLSDDYSGNFVDGGEYGAGGGHVLGYGAGGGGWNEDGTSDGIYGEGGFAFSGSAGGQGGYAQGCAQLAHGGYGGGGAGTGCGFTGAGGGGGYSGGGGGSIGGGGGSVSNGDNPVLHANKCTSSGHGIVTITLVEP